MTSPPTLSFRACLSVIKPLEVETIAIPKPLMIRGISVLPAYFRNPGLLILPNLRITGCLYVDRISRQF